jgi:hypothetical protein
MLQRTMYSALQYRGSPMRDFREVLSRLQAFRDKFEGLLASARRLGLAEGPPATRHGSEN